MLGTPVRHPTQWTYGRTPCPPGGHDAQQQVWHIGEPVADPGELPQGKGGQEPHVLRWLQSAGPLL
eukprot:6136621-Pyramimonas_sp.AAC.1